MAFPKSRLFKANALWFAIGMLAYSLVQAQKPLFLDPDGKIKTIATLHWQLLETADRLVRHGRQWVLRLATLWEEYVLFLRIRQRLREFIFL